MKLELKQSQIQLLTELIETQLQYVTYKIVNGNMSNGYISIKHSYECLLEHIQKDVCDSDDLDILFILITKEYEKQLSEYSKIDSLHSEEPESMTELRNIKVRISEVYSS